MRVKLRIICIVSSRFHKNFIEIPRIKYSTNDPATKAVIELLTTKEIEESFNN